MKFYITRTSDPQSYSVIEAEHLEDCIRKLEEYACEFVVSIITENDKKHLADRDENGNFAIVYDEKQAEAFGSCDFEVEIYDDYRE